MATEHTLAQVNIALAREPLYSPLLAEFMAALEPIDAHAHRAAGFVWRMQPADRYATANGGFGDEPRLVINLTVWESLEAMRAFVYRDSQHVALMRRRREWFAPLDLHTALWWVPLGHQPTIAEAEHRLEHLRAHGPTTTAFTFRQHFDRPDTTVTLECPRSDGHFWLGRDGSI